MLYLWIALFIAFVILEVCTEALVSVWFLPGALISGILSAFDLPIWLQITAFLVLSIALLVFTRPLTKKLTHVPLVATNADRAIGEVAAVTEEINAATGTGAVKVLGKVWSAKSEDRDTVFPIDTEVRVVRMEGVYLIVSKVEA